MSPYKQVHGFATRYTSQGWCVVEIDYWADPKRTPAWAEEQRRGLLNENQFRREFCRDWSLGSGRAFYPEFQLHKDRYIRKSPGLINAPIYRGWDFGYRKPALLCMQYSPQERRLWCLREIIPDNIDTHSFAILVRYLCGQEDADILARYPKAAYWVKWMRTYRATKDPTYPTVPWFEPGEHFIDYSGPEATKVSPTVEAGTKERTDKEVLASYGIFLNSPASSLKDRETLIRSLLHFGEDGHPGLLIDPSCFHLVNGMNGGVAYPDVGTKNNPFPDEPQKDGHYEHIHDCLGYSVINLVPKAIERRPSPYSANSGQPLDLKELREPVW